jgi:hypothetical protein
VADPYDISQLFIEAAAVDGSDQASQLITEVLSTTGPDHVSQLIAEAAPTTGPDQGSQLIAEAAPTTGRDQISQLTIELLRGPEIVPPEDNPTQAYTFDAGLGLDYFLVLQPSDSGIELRDKVVKAYRVTGKTTRGKIKGYGWGPLQNISVDDVEQGTNARTTVIMQDTTDIQQSKRFQVNLPNSMMHTVRVEGVWDGVGPRDRIDEIVVEVSQQGIRR